LGKEKRKKANAVAENAFSRRLKNSFLVQERRGRAFNLSSLAMKKRRGENTWGGERRKKEEASC